MTSAILLPIFTGDETLVHFREPGRKAQNKAWVPKGGSPLQIARRIGPRRCCALFSSIQSMLSRKKKKKKHVYMGGALRVPSIETRCCQKWLSMMKRKEEKKERKEARPNKWMRLEPNYCMTTHLPTLESSYRTVTRGRSIWKLYYSHVTFFFYPLT